MRDLLVIGAGPYGLATAAYAQHVGLDVVMTGVPMALWRFHMPRGMHLRSPPHWHIDPLGKLTFTSFLADLGRSPEGPIPLELFLDYAACFQTARNIEPLEPVVQMLRRSADGFLAVLPGGGTVRARKVVVATGLLPFAFSPPRLAAKLPDLVHSSQVRDFAAYRGRRLLIVGGRQSAYESAALALEAGAESVVLSHRHETPRFERSSWGWAERLVTRALAEPAWFLRSPDKVAIGRRFWEEGRLKLEPWLAERVTDVSVHPHTEVEDVRVEDSGVAVRLTDGGLFQVDAIIAATGYSPNLSRLGFLAPLLADIAQVDGYPSLDETMCSSVPGLHFTGVMAARDFGPFFGFVLAVPTAARVLVDRAFGRTPRSTPPGTPIGP